MDILNVNKAVKLPPLVFLEDVYVPSFGFVVKFVFALQILI